MKKDLSEMSLEELWELFPIILKEHNSCYKEWYESEKSNIIKCINNDDIYRINHIGSSVVKNLIAKPTIDILLELNRTSNISQITSALVNNDWTLMSQESEPELKFSFNKGYTPSGFEEKVYHLHVRYLGDWNELYFRDYLIEHSEVAKEYGRLKMSLWKKYEHNRDGYTNAKTEFVTKFTEKARMKYADRYKP